MGKLTEKNNGLLSETECAADESASSIPNGEEPKPPQLFIEKVTVPEEANVQPKGSWKILLGIFACAVPLIACVALLLSGLQLPAGICAGVFAVAVTVFLLTLFVAEKRLKSGKAVLNKRDTRKIIATVTESVCVTRSYKNHRDSYGRFYDRELVGAVYAVTLKESGEGDKKTYVAKTETYYAKGEEVAAYVRGKYAYIDETDAFNAKNRL